MLDPSPGIRQHCHGLGVVLVVQVIRFEWHQAFSTDKTYACVHIFQMPWITPGVRLDTSWVQQRDETWR